MTTKDQRIAVLERQVADLQARVWNIERGNVFGPLPGRECYCGTHRHGESTGGWDCPMHGHQL